jgi:hypothetical protein
VTHRLPGAFGPRPVKLLAAAALTSLLAGSGAAVAMAASSSATAAAAPATAIATAPAQPVHVADNFVCIAYGYQLGICIGPPTN